MKRLKNMLIDEYLAVRVQLCICLRNLEDFQKQEIQTLPRDLFDKLICHDEE